MGKNSWRIKKFKNLTLIIHVDSNIGYSFYAFCSIKLLQIIRILESIILT